MISSIEYDDPNCHQTSFNGATAACSSWNPKVRVIFDASSQVANLTNSDCQGWSNTTLRCDDPADLSGSGGLAAPKATNAIISNGTTTTTKYYSVNGQRVAMVQGSTWYYLIPDLLGSTSLVLKADGTELYAPYGSVRYSDGSMPTTYTFTGQRLDDQTGLLYYNSRYYDPVSGRFTSADTVQNDAQGMDPYAYVGDDPVGRTAYWVCGGHFPKFPF